MAVETLRVLGQRCPVASSLEILYTVPDGVGTVVSSLVVCNRTGGAVTVRLSVAESNAPDDAKQYLYYDLPVASKDTFAASLGVTLSAGDTVRVWASAADVAFQVFGSEVTV